MKTDDKRRRGSNTKRAQQDSSAETFMPAPPRGRRASSKNNAVPPPEIPAAASEIGLVGASRPPVQYPLAEHVVLGYVPPPHEVFEQLYSGERDFVRRTVERYGVPMRDADDVVQEVFAVALRRISDLDAARSARPWLFVIAMQLATNYRKLARHRMEPLTGAAPPELASSALEAESALLAGEEQALARELIGRMRPKLREILVMHDLEERPMAEIVEKLGIPPKTAYARLKLARSEALRRGRALAASSIAVASPNPLRRTDLLRVREVLLTYGRPMPRQRKWVQPPARRYPTRKPSQIPPLFPFPIIG